MQIAEFFSDPREICSYYNDRRLKFRYFYIQECSIAFCQGLIERGWRRFGEYFFVPICKDCQECISIRQLPQIFTPSKSQRRVIAKNQDTKITITRPSVTREKIALYNKYHKTMEGKKGWVYRPIDSEVYSENFVYGFGNFGFEVLYRVGGKLVGVGYFDLMKNSISATYFFYDHDYQSLSLGTFNILTQLLLAKNKGLEYFYPGYWIKDHFSMGYKEKFQPFEILINRPDIFESPFWKPYSEHLLPPKYTPCAYQKSCACQNIAADISDILPSEPHITNFTTSQKRTAK
ncbi:MULTISPECIES: arginyltransferase [unclassified Helicobacter]|uniref:arginyltransferase n=1 Tax=Helicobacter sp. CLO-3 TaxID=211 RepID=UPI0009ECFE22